MFAFNHHHLLVTSLAQHFNAISSETDSIYNLQTCKYLFTLLIYLPFYIGLTLKTPLQTDISLATGEKTRSNTIIIMQFLLPINKSLSCQRKSMIFGFSNLERKIFKKNWHLLFNKCLKHLIRYLRGCPGREKRKREKVHFFLISWEKIWTNRKKGFFSTSTNQILSL